MSNINPSALAEMREAQQEAEQLSKKTLNAQEEKRFNYLLSKISAIKQGFVPQEERNQKADEVRRELGLPRSADQRARENDEADKAFRQYLRDGDKKRSEYRTYIAESTDPAAMGPFIPKTWADQYSESLKSFNGLRQAGSSVVTTNSSQEYHAPIFDDSANVGERISENASTNLSNPTVSSATLAGWRYSSKGITLSNELIADSNYDLNIVLQSLFAKRIGRITNSEFSNGASGGPAGVLPSLSVGVTTASTSVVTVAELLALPKSLDYGYRAEAAQPCWMFSQGVEAILKGMLDSNGRRMFPEMDGGKLMGDNYVINVDMPQSLIAAGKAIAFGSFKLGVLIREVTPIVTVSKERYAEYFQTYYSVTHRQDVAVVDSKAVALLQMHA